MAASGTRRAKSRRVAQWRAVPVSGCSWRWNPWRVKWNCIAAVDAAALCRASPPHPTPARVHSRDLVYRHVRIRPGVAHPRMDGAAFMSAGVTASGQCFPAQSATHRSRHMNTGQEIFTSNLLILRSLCCCAALMSGQLSQSRNMNLDIHSRSVELFQISPHAYRPRPYWLSAPLRPTAPRVIGRAPFVYVFINIYLYYKPRLRRAGRDGTAQAPRCSGCGHHTHASAARQRHARRACSMGGLHRDSWSFVHAARPLAEERDRELVRSHCA